MKISEMIIDRYKLRMPPTVYYDLLADVQEAEEEQEPKTGYWKIKRASIHPYGNDVACSECGFTMSSSFGYKYCPNCGAKMAESEVDNGDNTY